MQCKDIESCFNEINLYFNGAFTGKCLLVNTENYTDFQSIRAKLELYTGVKTIRVSSYCSAQGIPNVDEALDEIAPRGNYALIGLSQAAMLRNAAYLDGVIGKLLQMPIHGHAVVLLDHCENVLKKYLGGHPDIKKRVVFQTGNCSVLPRLRLAESEKAYLGDNIVLSLKQLFGYLEEVTDESIQISPEVTVITHLRPQIFDHALFSVTACDGVYESMQKKYSDVKSATEKNFGTEQNWQYLSSNMAKYHSLSGTAAKLFGSTSNLVSNLPVVLAEGDKNKLWCLWLSMKTMGTPGNKYMTRVMRNSAGIEDLEEHVYMDLLELPYDNPDFRQNYFERKQILKAFPENFALLDKYCARTGKYQKNGLYYLTNATEKEELAFMACLSLYEYSEEEVLKATEFTFPELHLYLQPYAFNAMNTRLPEDASDLREKLNAYFRRYKLQKVLNRIEPEFLETVEEYASERPYNMLQPRSAVVKKLDKKSSQLYFFDALGVEYLAYIQAKCEQYGLVGEVAVARCELPSITAKNKEFLAFFPNGALDIKELDELKHHSQIIDYQKCKLPVHLFRELEIIDGKLRNIKAKLQQETDKGETTQAIIVSDHGASRLAVIREQENPLLEMEDKGEHSGRCCPAAEDPKIPYASYWDGYSILANYDRFKGSRKANVEVHGGATLEEVLVPVITLSLKPANIEICFVDPVIKLKGKEEATITVFTNIPLHEPKLMVNGILYSGELVGDSKHAKFTMPELKRSKALQADFYDGERKLAKDMQFRVQKGETQERELFKKNLF